MESNHLPSGYEPLALTDELHPHGKTSISDFKADFLKSILPHLL
jgi:hypothetical protein